ncbi:MAG: SpaA isopeptide-forming pilin-related protein [Anaerostipes sp.]|nr:SpaA isopeptide-forming pilin-related protein [Anaerostipes sp.]
MKGKAKRVISGLLTAMTLVTSVLQPMVAYAATEEEVPHPPKLEEVIEQLSEDEIVTAKDLEINLGTDFDVKCDFSNLEFHDEKVKVTYHESKNEAGEDFDSKKADTYQTTYYVEPISGNPQYQVSRKLIVKEATEPETESNVSNDADGGENQKEDTSEEDAESDNTEAVEPTQEDTENVIEDDSLLVPGNPEVSDDAEKVLENVTDDTQVEGEKSLSEMTDDEICNAAIELIQAQILSGESELKFTGEDLELYNFYQNIINYGNRYGSKLRASAGSLVVKNAKNESGMWDIPLLNYIHSSQTGSNVGNYVKYIANDSANGWRLAYCTQVSKHFIDSTSYISQTWKANGMYSEISYAIAHGCSVYGDTNDKSYSTGNWIKDYYVTQAVIYCILEDYGYDGHSVNSLSAVSGYQDVFDCTMAMYRDVKANAGKEGYGDAPSYTVVAPSSTKMTLSEDKTYYRSGWYTINSKGTVKSRTISLSGAPEGCEIVYDNASSLTSRFYIQIPVEKAFLMPTDTVSFKVNAEAKFERPYTYIYNSEIADAQNITFQEYHTPSETKGSEASVSITLDKCKVAVNKVDSETGNGVAGAIYGVYKDAACTNLIAQMPATDRDGHSTIEFVKRQNTVYVKEITASVGYLINTDSVNVGVVAKQTSTVNVKEVPAKGKIVVSKKDKETDSFTPQGDATMVGAKYGLYAKTDIIHPDGHTGVVYPAGSLVDQKIFGESGIIEFTNLYFGSYYVKEIDNPEGYLMDPTEYPARVLYKDQYTAVVVESTTVYETVKKQPFEIIKISSNGSSTETKLVEGAEFTVKLESEVKAKGWDASRTYDTLITDGKGYAVSIDLPYGVYHVKETKTPKDMNTTKDFYVNVSEDSRTPQIWRVFNDAPFTAYIRLIKKDVDTGEIVQLGGTTFKIRDVETGEDVSMKVGSDHISTFSTDESGMVTTPLQMLPGKYEVYEITAPFGYLVRTDAIPFTVTAEGGFHADEDGDFVVDVEIENKQQYGDLHIYKHGEQLAEIKDDGVVAKMIAYVKDAMGFETATNIDFTYEDGPVEGAEFKVIVDETIYTADHQVDDNGNRIIAQYEGVSLEEGSVVAVLTTNQEGKADLKNLPLGKYHVEESVAGDGFVLNTTIDAFALEYAGQDVEIVTHDSDFENQRVKVKVELKKNCEKTEKAVEGATYGLYAEEDIATKAGDVLIEKDSLIEHQVTDEEGTLSFKADLPLGKYYVKELVAAEGYLLDEEVYHLDLTYQGQEKALVLQTLQVTDVPITLEVKKTDITTGEEIEGAHLQIVDEKGDVFEEWDSTKEPHVVYGIPAGDYTLVETLAPTEDGYVKAADVEFTIEETGEVQQIEMKDDYTKVEISKTDVTGEKELPGASLTILDKDGKEVDSWVSTDEVHYIEKLPVGKYTLHEEAAPDGYQIASDVEFEVKETAEIQTVVMVDEKVPETPTESETPNTTTNTTTTSQKSGPKTGDNTAVGIWILVLALSGISGGVMIFRKRKLK